jgi:surface antigen
MRTTLLSVVLGATLVSACATKSQTGTAVGVGAGALVGHAVGGDVGMLLGGALGGVLGYTAGTAMEQEDRRRIAYSLERNEPMEWRNTQTGGQYRVEPIDTRYQQGRECREFRLLAEVEGTPDEMRGTACRRPDGSWEMLSG